VTLDEFLAARLDKDEAEAMKLHSRQDGNIPLQHAMAARVLREVEAKRKILVDHAAYPWSEGFSRTGVAAYCSRCARHGTAPMLWPCPTVKALAAVWSDHPDYSADLA
jgi:hypothetical protein